MDETSIDLFISTQKNNIITYDSYEVKPSLNTLIDIMEHSDLAKKFNFNSSKSLKEWTSISFHDNKQYQSTKQTKNNFITCDVSGNINLIENSKSVLLFEEVVNDSKLKNIISLLVENNFEKYNKLMNIRQVEDIIFIP